MKNFTLLDNLTSSYKRNMLSNLLTLNMATLSPLENCGNTEEKQCNEQC